MKIKEVEAITGITKQNIRFYEKENLLHPSRTNENSYREYSEEDIRILKIIKLFRKLDMPIEEIRRILQYDIELSDALLLQQERLQKKQETLLDALNFCKRIHDNNLASFDPDKYLTEMTAEEQKGSVFTDFLNDYKRVIKTEELRKFSFMPDTMCMNPKEFTDALCKYASENDLNLIITKESMYPEFTINGIEYEAYRNFGRFGAIVYCEMKHPEIIFPKGISKPKYTFYKWLAPVLTLTIFCILMSYGRLSWLLDALLSLIPTLVMLIWAYNIKN